MRLEQIFVASLLLRVVTSSYIALADQEILAEGPGRGAFRVIRRALFRAHIIDEVVDDFYPKCIVIPHYGKKDEPVSLGNSFKKKETKKRPSLKIYCPDKKETTGLTIALTDPDAPSADDPKWSEMCHWVAVIPIPKDQRGEINIDMGGDDDDCDDDDGEKGEIIEYKAPGPPKKTGYHRYVFVLLEGDNTNLTAPADRKHWGFGDELFGVRDWARQEGLKVIGANYFIEKHKKQ